MADNKQPVPPPKWTPEEQEIIDFMQRCKGETPLTEQEIYLGLEQARHIGEL